MFGGSDSGIPDAGFPPLESGPDNVVADATTADAGPDSAGAIDASPDAEGVADAVSDVASSDSAVEATKKDSSPGPDSTADGTLLDAAESGTDRDSAADVGAADGPPVPTTITFVSGADWPWFAGDLGGADGGSLGMAAVVCVTPTSPPTARRVPSVT